MHDIIHFQNRSVKVPSGMTVEFDCDLEYYYETLVDNRPTFELPSPPEDIITDVREPEFNIDTVKIITSDGLEVEFDESKLSMEDWDWLRTYVFESSGLEYDFDY